MTDEEELARREEDVRLQIVHARQALQNIEKRKREARRAYQREWYAKNRDQQLEYQRQYRQAAREKDPEKFAQQRRGRAQRWRDRHKEQENAKIREKYPADPEPIRARSREYYAEHAEALRAQRRAHYRAHKNKELAAQAAWRDREKTRRQIGLPPRRLHETPSAERRASLASADAFFTRTRTRAEIAQALEEIATPPELIAAWKRDCLRARATHHLSEQSEVLARLQLELGKRLAQQRPQRTEDARMDDIALRINERLRTQPRRTQPQRDPAAPHPLATNPTNPMGMNR